MSARDVTEAAIAYYMEGKHGLLPRRWRAQLAELRALPETSSSLR